MRLWTYIREFYLFRWLLNKLNRSSKEQKDDSTYRYDSDNCGYNQLFDDFHEEQDDYDFMDDF